MARDRQTAGLCSRCNRGTVNCLYNYFVKDARTIHSWEHRCDDCGHRETEAFRSDDPELNSATDPTVCPYCKRQAAAQ
jgi:hypothetical protein